MPNRLGRRAALIGANLLVLPRMSRAQSSEIASGEMQLSADGGPVTGVYAKPGGSGPFPIVLVAENGTGLDRVVSESCQRLAKEGFFAVAPSLFAGDAPDGTVMRRLDAAASWAAQHGADMARLGIVGFGPGGRIAWLYDASHPTLKAAIAWGGAMEGATDPAGSMTALDAASHLHAPLLGLFGNNDGTPRRVLFDAEARAKQAGKIAETVVYVGAGRDFAVPGSPSFDEAATLDGWQRTLRWLRSNGVH